MLAAAEAVSPAAMLLSLKGIGPEFTAVLWSEGLSRHLATDDSWPPMRALHRHPGSAGQSITTRGLESGNPRLRATLIQLAWLWLRCQSALGAHVVVPRSGQAQWRAVQENDDCCACP
ncbi:transposase [Mesorhizobium sp. M0768]|uniref:transposase n=1 Tax=Mesorhizobium sp. M0768 TaxID=2956996 RepID=UPI00333D237C